MQSHMPYIPKASVIVNAQPPMTGRARRLFTWATLAALVVTALFGSNQLLFAQSNGYGKARYDLYQAAPPAIAAYYPYAYQGEKILQSATVDEVNSTVTLPLYQGKLRDGRLVWYVLTDVSDPGLAEALGLNYSAKLRNIPGKAARTATLATDGTLVFDQGTVDFSPERKLVPGAAPNFFPPAEVQPGSVGDAEYSPLVRVTNAGNVVYNATMVAFDVTAEAIEFPDGDVDYSKVIDRATAISPANGTVTFKMNLGTSDGRPVLFISLESNAELVSALEATTYTPALSDIPTGLNDMPQSAVAANYIIVNGPIGENNPQRQGLNSALSGDPSAQVLDIFDGAPGVVNDYAYSPMWDLYVAAWTPKAIEQGYQSAIYSELQFLGLVQRGWLTTPDGEPMGSSGLISNCPLIMHY